jgi:hypothetical protein
MNAVLRRTTPMRRLVPAIGVAVMLAACGAPPKPLPTAPPEPLVSAAPPSGYAYPSGPVPSYPLPGASLPAVGYPRYPTLPTYPVPTLPTVTATPTTPGPAPAPRCTNGPTSAQVLAVVKGKPGIPTDEQLKVWDGPFCSKSWQFTTIGVGEKDNDKFDPLLVVTTGKPSALTVVEAGADVCSDHVQNAAPPGIRVLACGS